MGIGVGSGVDSITTEADSCIGADADTSSGEEKFFPQPVNSARNRNAVRQQKRKKYDFIDNLRFNRADRSAGENRPHLRGHTGTVHEGAHNGACSHN